MTCEPLSRTQVYRAFPTSRSLTLFPPRQHKGSNGQDVGTPGRAGAIALPDEVSLVIGIHISRGESLVFRAQFTQMHFSEVTPYVGRSRSVITAPDCQSRGLRFESTMLLFRSLDNKQSK